MHVQEVELGELEQLLEGLRHVERERTDPPRRKGSDCPTASIEAQPVSAQERVGSERIALTVARPSRISSRESDGAMTTTRWPREHSSSESRSTNRLTSWWCSQGQGVTWAIENGTGTSQR